MKKKIGLIIVFVVVLILVVWGYRMLKYDETHKILMSYRSKKSVIVEEGKVLSIAKETNGMNLLEYDNTNQEYAQIYYIYSDYSTDPSLHYYIDVKNENNDSILIHGANDENGNLACGWISSMKIHKSNLSQKIYLFITEELETNHQVLRSEEIELDLKKDLEEINHIDQSDKLEEMYLGTLKFVALNDNGNVYHGSTQRSYR